MNLKRYVLIFLLTLSVNGFGKTIYYTPAATGDNNGTTWGNAYEDWATVIANFVGGDTLRGNDTITNVQFVPPSGGTFSDRTAIIGGNGVDNTPTWNGLGIWGGIEATGWTNVSGNIYRCQLTQTSGAEGYAITNTTATGCWQDTTVLVAVASYAELSAGEYFWTSGGDDSLYVYLFNLAGGYDPNNYTIYASCKVPVQLGYVNNLDHNTISYLNVQYGARKGIMFGGDNAGYHHDSIFIEHNTVKFVSGTGSNNMFGIGAMSSGTTDSLLWGHYNQIVGCTIMFINNARAYISEHRNGITLYSENNITIDSNYIYALGEGIDNKGGVSPIEKRNDRTRWNVIVDCYYGIVRDGGTVNDSIYGNIVYNRYYGVDGPKAYLNDFHGGEGGKSYIFNNTFITTKSTTDALAFGATDGYGTPDSIYFKYNVIASPNGDVAIILKYGGDTLLLSDSNVFYTSWSFSTQSGSGNETWWQGLGYDTHSPMSTNPSFTDTTLAGLNLAPTGLSAWSASKNVGGWTVYGPGAVQTLWEPVGEFDKFVKLKNIKNTGGIKLK